MKWLELDSFKDCILKLGIQYKTKEPFAQIQSIDTISDFWISQIHLWMLKMCFILNTKSEITNLKRF